MFLASVLVRLLHPCFALALWKLLRGCRWFMAAECSCGGRISLTLWCLYAFALRCCGHCGKHLTNSLVLHFFAAARMKVESISQALCSCTCLCTAWQASGLPDVSFTSAHHCHVLCGMSIHNFTKLILKPVSTLPPRIGFLVVIFFGRSGPRPRNRKCKC